MAGGVCSVRPGAVAERGETAVGKRNTVNDLANVSGGGSDNPLTFIGLAIVVVIIGVIICTRIFWRR
jgi:hypothetical protein